MAWVRVSGPPRVEVAIDMGHPFLNLTVDAFLRIGTIAATRVGAEDTYHIIQKRNISSHDFEKTLKKMCKEGVYWGTVAGLYVGTGYGVERIRGTRDWKNAMIGGAVTGAVVSAVSNNKKDKIAIDAITGAAIATAAEFINYLE
ncbi:outer envelope pore protein 16, chloroplastic [Vigna radiata var. radiata]|uniref:Outer envelope pore protein 16, chloroplastic n=1 Tax=Vigna radiata var. radiata TaxID=3916 RepID=A0A1S3TS34_VIGRR|nr:outer envelope pore protein 16, chloroplastic [Vigna radiata var. radiata]